MPCYRFRSKPPNQDIVFDHSGEGYPAIDEPNAWMELARILSSQTQGLEKSIETLQTRYTIEEVQWP